MLSRLSLSLRKWLKVGLGRIEVTISKENLNIWSKWRIESIYLLPPFSFPANNLNLFASIYDISDDAFDIDTNLSCSFTTNLSWEKKTKVNGKGCFCSVDMTWSYIWVKRGIVCPLSLYFNALYHISFLINKIYKDICLRTIVFFQMSIIIGKTS